MKVKEIISIIVDKVIIYKAVDEGFKNIYKGNTNNIPANILKMEIRIIGASKKRIIDIQVF